MGKKDKTYQKTKGEIWQRSIRSRSRNPSVGRWCLDERVEENSKNIKAGVLKVA